MAGFSVGDHRLWRDAEPEPLDPEPPGVPDVGPAPDASDRHGPSQDLDTRLKRLGLWSIPARLHDVSLGRVPRGAFYHVARFLLVVATVLLVVNGVQAENPVVRELGGFDTVTPYSSLDAYPTPRFTYQYEIGIDRAQGPKPTAFFDVHQGTVRVPELERASSAYALMVNVVRVDDVEPVLMLKEPGGAYRSVKPSHDDGLRMTYAPVELRQTGTMGILLVSAQGSGSVELQLAIAEAPVGEREMVSMARVAPLAGGAVLGTVLLGAYAPGAALLQQRNARRRDAVDAAYARSVARQPTADATGHARISWGRRGVMAWRKPGREAAEDLAELPGPGWVIRLD